MITLAEITTPSIIMLVLGLMYSYITSAHPTTNDLDK